VFFNIFFPLEFLMVTEFPFLNSSLWNLVECICHFLSSFFLIIPVNNLIRSNDQHKGLFYLFVQCHDPLSSGYFVAWYNLTVYPDSLIERQFCRTLPSSVVVNMATYLWSSCFQSSPSA